MFELEEQNDQSKKIKVYDIFIDQDYIQKWGLKTTQDGKRNYWRVRGDLFFSKSDDDSTSTSSSFRVNLPASEKTFGADKSVLKTDLKRALDNFKKDLKDHVVYYDVVIKNYWNYQEKTIDYGVWFELKIQKYHYKKVSIFEK